MRVVIAEDLVLLRDGLVRLLTRLRVRGRRRRRRRTEAGRSGRSSTGRTSRSSTSGCRRRSPTRACARRCEARRRCPGMPVLVLSQYVERALRRASCWPTARGGVGYLLKDRVADVGEFVDARAPRRGRRDGARPRGGRAAARPRAPATGPLDDADPARARGARADGRGTLQHRHRRRARTSPRGGREARHRNIFGKLDLPPTDDGPPPGAGGARVPAGADRAAGRTATAPVRRGCELPRRRSLAERRRAVLLQ